MQKEKRIQSVIKQLFYMGGKQLLVVLLVASWIFSGYPPEFFSYVALAPEKVEAASGDFAVYREITAVENIPTTVTSLGWDTNVSQGAGFTKGGASNELIDLTDAGHYLVMYNLGFETSGGNNRSEIQSQIELGGTDLEYGRSTCYIRRSAGTDECWLAGAAIIDASAGDDVKIEAWRTDSNTATVQRRAGESGLMITRLDESWDYARIYEAGGGQTFNTAAFQTVLWDTNDELDAGTFSRTGGDITLASTGHYLVTANVHFNNSSGSARRNEDMRLTLNGFELPGTRTSAYLRGQNSTQDHVTTFVGVIEATTTNQVLNVQGACEGEACGGVTNVGASTAITIVKLPDSVEYIRLNEAGGGQAVDGTNDPILWDTNTEVDAAFTHSTVSNTSRITINTDDDYLFLGSFYSFRTLTTDSDRLYPHWNWRVNGTAQTYGSFGKFNRGQQGDATFSAGNSGGFIAPGLTSGDYVELANTDESTGTDASAVFPASRLAVQGIRMSTLRPIEVTVSSSGSQKATSTIPVTSQHIGGTFVVAENVSSRNVTSLTITETGSIDAEFDLDNIKIQYDLDTTAPYDCASETYAGSDTQFGSTDVDGFSSFNGTSVFTGSVGITTTSSMCAYVVMDIKDGARDGETVIISIDDPETEVVVDGGGVVEPDTSVSPTGSTLLVDDNLTQAHYHWRNDDGTEAAATSATGGTEDTALATLNKGTTMRLRTEISNEGSATSSAKQYRLEYAAKVTTCSVASGWTDVGAVGGDWDMSDTVNLTDGNDTTNIAEGIGGVTDENTIFLTPNAGVKDTSSQTGNITLGTGEFVEIEYGIVALPAAPEGTTYCFRLTDAGTALHTYNTYPEASLYADVTVGVSGVQISSVLAGDTYTHIGGLFSVLENTSSRTVTDIVLTESGTIDASADISNVTVKYDLDTTAPYDCASESYSGNETQFGATSTAGFSQANGTTTFSGSVTITTTQTMCIYTVMDISADTVNGKTIDIQITNPSNEVAVSGGGIVSPTSLLVIPGSTIVRNEDVRLMHYHWRNDDGTEAAASSATNGTEDTARSNFSKNTTIRLRMELSNEGLATSTAKQYRLEYGKKITTCSVVSGWTDVGAALGDWDMSNTANLTDGNNTTNILNSIGGVTDEATTFLTSNAGVKDTSSQTANITLDPDTFTELEYSIIAADSAPFGTGYCFRVTDAGVTADITLSTYAELSIRENKDFYIQRGTSTIALGNTDYTIYAGTDYDTPSASTSAFIRISNTQHTGAGNNTGGGNQNADDVTAYILNPSNILTSITFRRAGVADNTRISWEIVEYIGDAGGDNEMIVRDQRPVTFTTTGLVASTTLSGLVSDNADVVAFVTGAGNPDTGTGDYNTGLVTSYWDGTNSEMALTRGEAGGDAINVSTALVEFTGANWKIQRAEHNYSVAGTSEQETITSVGSLARSFLHTQKRTGAAISGLDEFGHEVWFASVSQVSFRIQSGATSPTSHYSVAWVIENTMTTGVPMVVTRSNGTNSGGAEPLTLNVSIGKTLGDTSIASIFTNNRGSGTGAAFPRTIVGVTILNETTYQLWFSDTGQTQTYRTEVVEWPTAQRTVTQNYYRFYVDNDLLDPTDPWPAGVSDLGENTSITVSDTPLTDGDVIRMRMSVQITGASMPALNTDFKLQYGIRDTACSGITVWKDVAPISSTTAPWRGYNGTPVDGTNLSINPPTGGDLNLSVSDRAGSYEEENNSIQNPFSVANGEDVEFDWVVQNNSALDQTTYCFQMVNTDDSLLDGYNNYPTLLTAAYEVESQNWRWYGDETNETPTSALALENVTPNNIGENDPIKLRITAKEISGKNGTNAKFRLQFSEYSDFSSGVYTVDEEWSCGSGSLWCYADGAGTDNATNTSAVLSDADSCVAGVGDGCGTHNESGTSTSDFIHNKNAATEFEFTIENHDAITNTVYFFRLWDEVNSEAVVTSTTYPSLMTHSGVLSFTITGLPAGTNTEGIVTDAVTTPTEVPFGIMSFGSEMEVAQRLTVTTGAKGGYQVLMYERQGFLSSFGAEIMGVTGTNALPSAWATGCEVTADGCYGYHTGDNSLSGGSTRFQADDTYAELTSTPEEIIYSGSPTTNEQTDIIYKLQIEEGQPAGMYESTIVHIIVGIF